MKKLFVFMFISMMCMLNGFAQDVKFNDNSSLELKQVITVEGASKDAIFTNIRTLISDALPTSNNSERAIDYSDANTGTIIAKGMYYIGEAKAIFGNKWHVYDNYTMTVKVKDGKFQISIKVPSIRLIYSGDKTEVDVETIHIYPQYDGSKLKSYVKLKQAVTEFGPKIPDSMKDLAKILIEKISKVDDDF